jgi:hypothetical protein
MPKFTGGFRLPTVVELEATERWLGVTFPDDYKQFLLTHNGGRPDPNCFSVKDRGDSLVEMLYGIQDSRTHNDLVRELEWATELEPLPNGFIAIGHDPGGGSLLLSTTGSDRGEVYFWARSWLWVQEDGYNTFPVANSFQAFLESLKPMSS